MKRFLTLISVVTLALQALAQPANAVLFNYAGDKKVTVDEFERYFKKNLNIVNQEMTPEKIREDLDLYIKFKLKIQDAHDAGMDTAKSYLQEVDMFREQLARSYLYDREVTDGLIREAYERLSQEVEVSHILIAVNNKAKPSDTLVAWQKIKGIYDRIVADPSLFAAEAKNSDDPGTRDNGGNLGYMTALQVVYPFENMAYNTPVGSISGIFRTDFGYHILKATNKRPNRGDIKLRHILLRVGMTPEGTEENQKRKIEDIYQKIKTGESTVADMARNFSEDFNSRSNGAGGEMDFINVTMFIGDPDHQSLEDRGFKLQNIGDYSEPFRTSLGWHIIQKMEVRPVGTFDMMKTTLKNQVQNNQRAQKSVDALVEKVKKENGYKEQPENMNALIALLDSNFVKGTFKAESLPEFAASNQGKKGRVYVKPNSTKTPLRNLSLFELGGQKYTIGQFASHLEVSMQPVSGTNMEFVNSIFKEWVKSKCVIYQDQHLEEKSPEFKHLYQEFKEGILMFARMQQKVWDKANEDTTGLKAFHEENRTKYKWNDRFDCEVYLCADKKMAGAVAKMVKKGIQPDSIRRKYTRSNTVSMDYRMGKYESTDTFLFPDGRILANLFGNPEYREKSGKIYNLKQIGSNWVVVKVNQFLPTGPKKLEECRGLAANDYQTFLEDQWLKDLLKAYPYSVNQPVFEAFSKRMLEQKSAGK
ncbi:MAG: peptidylprolyl isomerase [Sphingomonadales bacterium]